MRQVWDVIHLGPLAVRLSELVTPVGGVLRWTVVPGAESCILVVRDIAEVVEYDVEDYVDAVGVGFVDQLT